MNKIQLTASNLVSDINALNRNNIYEYPTKETKTKIMIVDIKLPEGPIYIKRWDCSGQLNLATVLEFSQYSRSDSLG
ncbi:hypothetical protein ACPUCY_004389, partial [Vibrio parahaemolyticus]